MKKGLLYICMLAAVLCACSPEQTTELNNTEEIVEYEAPRDEDIGKLCISEFMPKNHCTILDSDADFSDWIELTNCTDSSLNIGGWALSDGSGDAWVLPETELESGERILVFASGKDRKEGELHTDFKLSEDDSLCLYTPSGTEVQRFSCTGAEADVTMMTDSAEPVQSLYPSPGYENGAEGYESWQSSLGVKGPLLIYEVMTADVLQSYKSVTGSNDWVVIKNISDKTVPLDEYYLSDDDDDYSLWQFPDVNLAPGKSYLLMCSKAGYANLPYTGFELNSEKEQLYLTKGNEIIDYVLLRDIPVNGSYGRMDGENGWFFFGKAGIYDDNAGGKRRISEMPSADTEGGVFNDTESISLALEGKGTVYYTLDGSLPNENSAVYAEPISINETCVVRAIAVEEGALPSRALTLDFILNENHSLPVASLCVDDIEGFERIYNHGYKGVEIPGSFSLYEEGSRFSIGCGVGMTGQSSLTTQPKKNMKLDFRGVYGDSTLEYDLFGQDLKSFSSISLRAGQVYNREIFRQEVWQDLAIEMSDDVLSQYSKYAVLYINGEYYGITCIKENVSASYYAQHANVSKDSVQSVKTPDMDIETPDFKKEVYMFCAKNDLSKDENYAYIEERLDIDSFIDWMILEGVSGNQDMVNNARFFRSFEGSGKWQSVLVDLDKSMMEDYLMVFKPGISMPGKDFPFRGILGYSMFWSEAIDTIAEALFENAEFKDRFLRRYAEVYDTILSNERVLERMAYYEALLAPEIERNHERWHLKPQDWDMWVAHLEKAVIELDWQNFAKNSLCNYLRLSPEEVEYYFG